ncbi:flagellar assembly peptidoglycan hydrolase FlgJ [Pseudomonas sp. 102515]|uniref:flagellar assembly peptidoglycan hydrolase FlgJ n=1 Tax=Pseudomonas sp. 102515 TaxID=3071568 RepID=UPI0028029312|nr:flagellar assembly peptidoglycan hydrolase FlgJ [Pseudomonas sp. 102515]MDQ7912472.1 flagellar assembly peptidoglycan hydrolase FlgJ [Pseudomonas sp. 102515]
MESRLGGNYGNVKDSGAFTDLNRLAQMKGKDRDSSENVKKVAGEFESLFLSQMLKSMRSANQALADKDSPFSSETTKQYQDMYDQQLAVSLSRDGGGIGLANVLERQLSKTAQPSARPNPFAQVGQAAPTEGQLAAGRNAKLNDVASQGLKPTNAVASGRDDSSALNSRRLALPGRLAERTAANISGAAELGATLKQSFQDVAAAQSAWRQQATQPGSKPAAATEAVASVDSAAATGKTRFRTRQEFVDTMMPMAEAAAKRLGVDPKYLVAQAALETGWGKHMVKQADGSNSNNLFGIKSHGWDGGSAPAVTQEFVNGKAVTETAKFRTYDSFADSFHDYVNFLQSNDRYDKALSTNGNSERFMQGLQQAGYATDPQYARKVIQIARNMNTYQTVASLGTSPSRG